MNRLMFGILWLWNLQYTQAQFKNEYFSYVKICYEENVCDSGFIKVADNDLLDILSFCGLSISNAPSSAEYFDAKFESASFVNEESALLAKIKTSDFINTLEIEKAHLYIFSPERIKYTGIYYDSL